MRRSLSPSSALDLRGRCSTRRRGRRRRATRAHPAGAVHLRVRAGQALDGLGPAARRHGRPQRRRVRRGLPRRRLLLRGRLPAGRHARPAHAGDAAGAMLAVRLPEAELRAELGDGARSRRRQRALAVRRRRARRERSKRSKRRLDRAGRRRAAGSPSPTPSIRALSTRRWRRSPSSVARGAAAAAADSLRLDRHRRLDHRGAGDRSRLLGAACARSRCASPTRSPPWRATAGRSCSKSDPAAPCRRWRRRSSSEAALRGVTASLPDADAGDAVGRVGRLWSAGVAARLERRTARAAARISLPTYPFQRIALLDRAPRNRRTRSRRRDACRRRRRRRRRQRLPPVADASRCHASPALLAEIIDDLPRTVGRHRRSIPRRSFLELGFDSLLLGQAARAIEKKFRTKITFRQLLNETTVGWRRWPRISMRSCRRCRPRSPHARRRSAEASGGSDRDSRSRPARSHAGAVRRAAARAARPVAGRGTGRPHPTDRPAGRRCRRPRLARGRSDAADAARSRTTSRRWRSASMRARRCPRRAPQQRPRRAGRPAHGGGLPARVEGDRLSDRRRRAPRARSIWDIDGNEYIDLVNGFGQTCSATRPTSSSRPSPTQLDDGFAIGPQTPLAGEVAALVCEMTGNERVTFCNTGSEAVMAAMRVARTVTGRERVVVFTGDYHGKFDEVLVKARRRHGPAARLPVAPGIPPESIANMIVLRLRRAAEPRLDRGQRPASSPPCWSSRCRAAIPSCSRSSSCKSCARSPTRAAPR